jgi:hypothetical protein
MSIAGRGPVIGNYLFDVFKKLGRLKAIKEG